MSNTSLGNQTFQGVPGLHPDARRRLDDMLQRIAALEAAQKTAATTTTTTTSATTTATK